jgi:putative flippase GtrA
MLHQGFRFIFVGLLTVAVDYGAYATLMGASAVGVDLSKAVGFLVGTIFAYFANKKWTFGAVHPKRGSVYKFALVYSATLGVNVAVNSIVFSAVSGFLFQRELSFVAATFVSASLNFLGMKFFVFNSESVRG